MRNKYGIKIAKYLSKIIGKEFNQDYEKGTPINFDCIN